MKATYKIYTLPSGKRVPIISFEDKKYALLEDLLNVDLDALEITDITDRMLLVEKGVCEIEQICTECSMLEITKNSCKVYDNFEGIVKDEDLLPTVYVSFDELKSIVNDWEINRERLIKEIKGGRQ